MIVRNIREKNHWLTILPTFSTGTPNLFPSGPVPFPKQPAVSPPSSGWTTRKGPHPFIWLEATQDHCDQWSSISPWQRETLYTWSVHHHVASCAKMFTLESLQAKTWRPGSYSYQHGYFQSAKESVLLGSSLQVCLWLYIGNWSTPNVWSITELQYLFMLLSFMSLIEVYKSILLPLLKERNVYHLLFM